ncbi:MAG: hypothetical protein NVSMB64_02360 [Candidatus Velthaea sp.]
MLGTLARILTGWYVFVAVALVVLLVGGVTFAGLSFYAHTVNEQIDAVADTIPLVETRAKAAREDYPAAQRRLNDRLDRPGIIIRSIPPPPGVKSVPNSGEFGIFRVLEHRGGKVQAPPRPKIGDRGGPRDRERFGYAAATFLGIHPARRPFMGGFVIVSVDGSRVQTIVQIALAALLGLGLIAGLCAWAVGRYITSQALRPLYDVTASLQRFGGRDFTAQPIDVAGRGEFDALARAYNAAAAQVQEAFEERQQADAQMRQFVADAGHELRTPLTIVLGYIDMLKRKAPDDERSRRIFETIAIEGSRMRTLIDNLVLLAKLDSDAVRPIEPFELTELLEHDIVQTRRGIAPAARFVLDIAVDATVIGDRSEIYEAIANVVDNAIKYAPGSPVRIAVRLAEGAVEIAISDEGPGIAAHDREAIFDRFYRGASRGEIEGSGLGLAIAKRAIERAGGTLALGPAGSGTTFLICLRADRASERKPQKLPA